MFASISLGPYYNRNITETRRTVLEARARGTRILHVILSAQVSVSNPWIEIGLDPHSLYVLGFRPFGSSAWWEFEPEANLPALPEPTRRIIGGTSNYKNLALDELRSIALAPVRFLEMLRDFGGRLDEQGRASAILLLLVVPEALRFNSIQSLCYRWIVRPDLYFQAPDFYYARRHTPGIMDESEIVLDDGVKTTLREWRKRTEEGSVDVQVPWVGARPAGGP